METTIKKNSFTIENSESDELITDVRYNESLSNLPLVIFCHGFKGFKDWGSFPYLFDKLAQAGNFVASFNFSYNGTGLKPEEQSEFARLELFAKNTFSRELDDLGNIIDHFEKVKDEYNYDFGNLTLVGHSRGGGIAILKTAEDKRVKRLITLASVSNFNRYSERHQKEWKERGYFEVLNTRTNQVMRLNYTLMEDLEKNAERLDIEKAAEGINVPWLIVHGKEDLAVDYSNGESLYTLSNKESTELVMLEKTGHTFGAVHPFKGTTEALEEVATLVMDFIKQ